jgi:hypothetical protein
MRKMITEWYRQCKKMVEEKSQEKEHSKTPFESHKAEDQHTSTGQFVVSCTPLPLIQ